MDIFSEYINCSLKEAAYTTENQNEMSEQIDEMEIFSKHICKLWQID